VVPFLARDTVERNKSSLVKPSQAKPTTTTTTTMSLRQRRSSESKGVGTTSVDDEVHPPSVTELPAMEDDNGKDNVTPIPTAEKTKEMPSSTTTNKKTDETNSSGGPSHHLSLSRSSSSRLELELELEWKQDQEEHDNSRTVAMRMMTGAQVAKDESRWHKLWVRVVSGAGMIGVFSACVYSGHVYVCMIVALSQFLLFRELVKVRYNAHFDTIQGNTIPLFRTTQWMWFGVAIFYTYGDFISEVIQNNSHLHHLGPYAQYVSTPLAFILYSGTFVLTIATMQTGHIKFQLNQLCWTIVVLFWTVGQMKYIMHNIFNGLFWFTFPFLLVVVNDIMAYVSGMTCGRKFIQRPFIRFSPNKTWEGFIGGGIVTMVAAWYLSRALAQYSWMTCPTNEFRWLPPPSMECENHHVFLEAQSVFPTQIFELFPSHLVKMIPGIVEICSRHIQQDDDDYDDLMQQQQTAVGVEQVLERCISGETTHAFHHFELVLKNVYPIQIHALWLAFFASVVAPFGGFLASAIKRAYGIKDFDSFIPGHGGVTDRLDCQFLMALCTWVHYNTFVKLATISVPKLVYMYNLLSEAEKKAFVDEILAKSANLQIRQRLEEYSS
jgi:phosphatidate cytidylyltransferase